MRRIAFKSEGESEYSGIQLFFNQNKHFCPECSHDFPLFLTNSPSFGVVRKKPSECETFALFVNLQASNFHNWSGKE